MKKLVSFIMAILIAIMPMNLSFANEDNAPLSISSKSAILMDVGSGQILYEKNAHDKLPPASVTKVMTMLLICEALDSGKITLDDSVQISENAASMGGSQIFLKAGEKMKVEDLLKGIAIGSGNDATVAMAERIAGTEEAFVKLMNDRAKELGLNNTNFKNSTGLDVENHYSTAYDMSVIARELVKHKKILEFTGTYEDYLRKDSASPFWLVNTNRLVRFYQGVDGLKTGYTKEAGYCLTSTAEKDNMRLITVVMNEPSTQIRNGETSSMLDYGFNMYSVNKILDTDTSLQKSKVELGSVLEVEIVPTEEVKILNNKNSDERNVTYELELNTIKAPVKKGDIVGKIKVYEDNKVINEINATVKYDVDKANIFKIYYRNLENLFKGF